MQACVDFLKAELEHHKTLVSASNDYPTAAKNCIKRIAYLISDLASITDVAELDNNLCYRYFAQESLPLLLQRQDVVRELYIREPAQRRLFTALLALPSKERAAVIAAEQDLLRTVLVHCIDAMVYVEFVRARGYDHDWSRAVTDLFAGSSPAVRAFAANLIEGHRETAVAALGPSTARALLDLAETSPLSGPEASIIDL